MKIVFAGTSEFSAFHLKLLIDSNHEIPLVISQPDRRSGRGREIKQAKVKAIALKNNLNILQPEYIKNNEGIISRLKKEDPDIILVVAYGLIIPKEILNIPRLGCINIHASLLPRWRGAAPIERCILEGDKKSGISFMKMEVGLDTGPILKKVSCSLEERETSGSLENKLKEISKAELISFLEDLSLGKLNEEKQNPVDATYANKILIKENEIDWINSDSKYVDRKIRALSPKYGAYTFIKNNRVKIIEAAVDKNPLFIKPSILLIKNKNELHVGCGRNSSVRILKLQPAGKSSMSASEFIKGNEKKILKIKKFSNSGIEN